MPNQKIGIEKPVSEMPMRPWSNTEPRRMLSNVSLSAPSQEIWTSLTPLSISLR